MGPSEVLNVHKNERDDYQLYSALLLEQLWCVRNYMVFKEVGPSIDESNWALKTRFNDFKQALDKNDELKRQDHHLLMVLSN